MFSLWTASSFTSRNIASAPLALTLMLIHYWVAIRASQENWPKISVDFYPSNGRPAWPPISKVSLRIRGRGKHHVAPESARTCTFRGVLMQLFAHAGTIQANHRASSLLLHFRSVSHRRVTHSAVPNPSP